MHRRRGLAIGVVIALASVLVLGLVGGAVAAKKKTKVVKVAAKMDGANEVPPADPDATGTANFKLKKNKKKVCFEVEYEDMDTANVAHIHSGGAGVTGPPVVTLFEADGSTSPQSGCVKAKKGLIKKIGKNPKQYYANVHNAEYPGGAIRGQLKKGSAGSGGKNNSSGGKSTPVY